MNQFHQKRIELANALAAAGQALLDHTSTSAALAAIPNTEPQQYVVAGTLPMIAKVLPAESAATDWRPYHSALSRCAELLDNMKDGGPITDVPDFLAAKLKQCHLASQSQAAQPSIKTWRERLPEGAGISFDYAHVSAMKAEIAELRAHLAGQSQATRAVPDLHNAIMNLPCERTMSHFPFRNELLAYKEGHRDARHAAAELVNECEAAQEVTQQAAKAETAEQAEGAQANVLPPFAAPAGQHDAQYAAVWTPVTGPGQVKKSDKLHFTIGDKSYSERAKLILHAGTDKEEVIYDKGRNFYFITSMVVSGKSNHKGVQMLDSRFRAQGGNTNSNSAEFDRISGSDLAPTTSTVSAPEEIRNAALDEAANVCDRLRGGDSLEGAAYWDAAADECASCIRALRTASTATASGSTKASQAAASDAARNRAAEDANDTRRLDFLGGAAVVSMHQYEPSDGSPYIAIDLDLLGSPTVRGSTLRDAIDAAICALRTTSGKGEAA